MPPFVSPCLIRARNSTEPVPALVLQANSWWKCFTPALDAFNHCKLGGYSFGCALLPSPACLLEEQKYPPCLLLQSLSLWAQHRGGVRDTYSLCPAHPRSLLQSHMENGRKGYTIFRRDDGGATPSIPLGQHGLFTPLIRSCSPRPRKIVVRSHGCTVMRRRLRMSPVASARGRYHKWGTLSILRASTTGRAMPRHSSPGRRRPALFQSAMLTVGGRLCGRTVGTAPLLQHQILELFPKGANRSFAH